MKIHLFCMIFSRLCLEHPGFCFKDCAVSLPSSSFFLVQNTLPCLTQESTLWFGGTLRPKAEPFCEFLVSQLLNADRHQIAHWPGFCSFFPQIPSSKVTLIFTLVLMKPPPVATLVISSVKTCKRRSLLAEVFCVVKTSLWRQSHSFLGPLHPQ